MGAALADAGYCRDENFTKRPKRMFIAFMPDNDFIARGVYNCCGRDGMMFCVELGRVTEAIGGRSLII